MERAAAEGQAQGSGPPLLPLPLKSFWKSPVAFTKLSLLPGLPPLLSLGPLAWSPFPHIPVCPGAVDTPFAPPEFPHLEHGEL